MGWLFSWEVTSVVVALAISVALGVVALNDFGLAKFFFLIAAVDAVGGTIMGISRSGLNVWRQGVLVFIAGGGICLLLFLSLRYVDSKKEKAAANPTLQDQPVHNARPPFLALHKFEGQLAEDLICGALGGEEVEDLRHGETLLDHGGGFFVPA